MGVHLGAARGGEVTAPPAARLALPVGYRTVNVTLSQRPFGTALALATSGSEALMINVP